MKRSVIFAICGGGLVAAVLILLSRTGEEGEARAARGRRAAEGAPLAQPEPLAEAGALAVVEPGSKSRNTARAGGRRTLRFSVQDDLGAAVPGAEVVIRRARASADAPPLASGFTAVDGTVQLSVAGPFEALRAVARTPDAEARATGGFRSTTVLALRPIRRLHLQAREPRGLAAPGLRVLVRRPRAGGGIGGAHEQLVRLHGDSPDMVFAIDYEQETLAAAPAREAVALLQDGTSLVAPFAEADGGERAILALPRLAAVAVEVEAPEGAQVRLSVRPVAPDGERSTGLAASWTDREPLGRARHFVFGGFRPGDEVEVRAEAPGFFPARARVLLSEEEAATPLAVSLTRERPRLRARLVTAGGFPLAGRRLQARWSTEGQPLAREALPEQLEREEPRRGRIADPRDGTVRSDGEGGVDLVVPAGVPFRVELTPSDVPLPLPLAVFEKPARAPGEKDAEGDVVLAGPVLAAGTVLDEQGRFVPGASVEVQQLTGSGRRLAQRTLDRVRSDARGRFVLLGTAAQGLWLSARQGERATGWVAIAAGREGHALRLLPPASIRGRLRFANPEISGQLSVRLERVEERADHPFPEDPRIVNDRGGRGFVLPRLTPGTYELVTIYDRMEIERLPAVRVAAGEDLDLGEVLVGGTLRPLAVDVVTPEGQPRPRTVVRYLRRDPEGRARGDHWMTVRTATTDAAGRAVAYAPAEARIAVMVLQPGAAPVVRERPSWPERVVLGEPVTVELTFEDGVPEEPGVVMHRVHLRVPGQSAAPEFGRPETPELYPGDRRIVVPRVPGGRYEVVLDPVVSRRAPRRGPARPRVLGEIEVKWRPARQVFSLSFRR
jgi:hypothetical protein